MDRALPARSPIKTTIVLLLAVGAVGIASELAQARLQLPWAAIARRASGGVAAGLPIRTVAAEAPALAAASAAFLLKPLIVIGLLLAIERRAGPCRRAAKDRRLAWTVQALFLTAAIGFTLLLAGAGLIPDAPLISAGADPGVLRALPVFLLALLVTDFLRYWAHRAQHAIPALWRFHAVHHGARDLDVLHNITHPIEKLVNLLLVTVPAAWLVGADGGQLLLIAGFFAVHGHMTHMNVPLHFGPFTALVADNRFHFVHHSLDPRDHNSNFAALFPVIDMVFGTYRKPIGPGLAETGLADRPAPATLGEYLMARPGAGEGKAPQG